MRRILLLILITLLCGCEAQFTTPNDDVNIDDNKNVVEENIETIISNDLFGAYYENAKEILNNMTLEEKVGQVFLARYPGSKEFANAEIGTYYPSGYILFARDVKNETKESLPLKIEDNQSKSKIRMFIAIDEEGGTVSRIGLYKAYREKLFEAPLKIYQRDGMEAVIEDSKEKSKLLKELGFNMNLAPVVDIPSNTSSFMYARSMGTDSGLTSEFTAKIILQMNQYNMISCMKHFPGYGDNVDTHTGIAVDKRSLESFQENDFKPFIAGIESKAPCIMVNHNIIQCMDESMPASLSKNVHDILKNDLHFSGIIMTDDLSMDAVKSYVDNGNAAVQALLAGNDMIITSSLSKHVKEVLNAIKQGVLDERIVNEAAIKVISCKMAYGIINYY